MEKRVLSTLACVAICTLVMSTTSKANLLVDPGFEQGLTAPNPPTAYAQGWSFANPTESFLTTGLALGGTNVLDLTAFNSVPLAFQSDPASPGQGFTMTGNILVPQTLASGTAFAIIQMDFFSGPQGSGTDLGTVETSPGNAAGSAQITQSSPINTWLPVSVTAHAPAGAQSVNAYALVVDFTGTSESYYYDNLVLVPEPSTVAMALTGLIGLVAFAKKRRV